MLTNIYLVLLGKELKELKVTIQPGFHFQGKISILGFDVYLECTISHNPPSFHLIVELPAVKIGGGLIAVQKSKTEADKGPRLEADIKAAGVTIKINAFVTVLGISVGTVIDVSDNGLHFEVSGSLFGIVSAEVKLTSKYTDIKTASFHVRHFVMNLIDFSHFYQHFNIYSLSLSQPSSPSSYHHLHHHQSSPIIVIIIIIIIILSSSSS